MLLRAQALAAQAQHMLTLDHNPDPGPNPVPMMDVFDDVDASRKPASTPKRELQPKHAYLAESAPKRVRSSPGSGAGNGFHPGHG